MTSDRAELFNSLRASTAELLSYDADHLTAAQEIRINRAIALRLVIDAAQARQMRGEQIDVKEFVAASEDLERMVGGEPDGPNDARRFGPDHRARLHALINKTLFADAEGEAERLREVCEREELAAVVAAGAPVEVAKAAPAPVAPPPPAEQTSQPSNVAYLPSRTADGRPPPHYMKDGQPREPWREGAGALCAPYFPTPDDRRR